ncbi:DUF1699 family protein [uncultured Methanomethylovorans sp.]|uniref:DUF1699 family protein n=1 Tax=uncultured Methanomethylovorans sp. TaxID=183759 RepID=UPI002AA88D96|nr:DUF1699 family protein [uncultured Methanomethylovorans sp.]
MELNTNRVRLVTTKEQLETISQKDKIIHLTFCPSYTNIETILKKSPNIKALIIAESHWNRRSKALDIIINIAKIKIIQISLINTISTSVCQYVEVPEHIIEKIQSQKNLTQEQAHSILQEETEFPPTLIPFLIEVIN